MNCKDLCLACNRNKSLFVNYSRYHGTCDYDHGLQGFVKCVHCSSTVPILIYTPIFIEDDDDLQLFEAKLSIFEASCVMEKVKLNFRKPEQIPLESSQLRGLPKKIENLRMPNVNVYSGICMPEQGFNKKKSDKFRPIDTQSSEIDDSKVKSFCLESQTELLIPQLNQGGNNDRRQLLKIIVGIIIFFFGVTLLFNHFS